MAETGSDDAMPATAGAPHCVYCGATENLVADEHLQELWYCRACLARRDAHQDLIDHGCDDDDPSFE